MHYSKVYVYCPPNFTSGGPETLHTIVDAINNSGGNAFIYYGKKNAKIPNKYLKLNIKVTSKIEDDENNLLVVSENCLYIANKYKRIKKANLFLSTTFYEMRYETVNEYLKRTNTPKIFYLPVFIIGKLFKNKFKKHSFSNDIIYAANGSITKNFLVDNGIPEEEIAYICGPLNKEFIENRIVLEKENIIAYNPKKGYDFTKKIIDYTSKLDMNVKFIPIQNMSTEEVHNLLAKAKVYIDFGFHPGPERIPREAVISDCNIITSNLGSASSEVDVPIPDKYKFSCDDSNIEKISNLILEMIYNYSNFQIDFTSFKNKVLEQPQLFSKNVINYFYVKK